MITRDADLTRLLDRLESRSLVARQRQTQDRRVVQITVTPAGRALLAELDGPVGDSNKKLLGHMTSEQLSMLIELLELAREHAEDPEPLQEPPLTQ
jgi:DNA-binding MarR family transcriptional regulator